MPIYSEKRCLCATANSSHSHLVLEVITNPDQPDCNRVLLQATCPADVLLDRVRPFSILAICIDEQLSLRVPAPHVESHCKVDLQDATHYSCLGREITGIAR